MHTNTATQKRMRERERLTTVSCLIGAKRWVVGITVASLSSQPLVLRRSEKYSKSGYSICISNSIIIPFYLLRDWKKWENKKKFTINILFYIFFHFQSNLQLSSLPFTAYLRYLYPYRLRPTIPTNIIPTEEIHFSIVRNHDSFAALREAPSIDCSIEEQKKKKK